MDGGLAQTNSHNLFATRHGSLQRFGGTLISRQFLSFSWMKTMAIDIMSFFPWMSAVLYYSFVSVLQNFSMEKMPNLYCMRPIVALSLFEFSYIYIYLSSTNSEWHHPTPSKSNFWDFRVWANSDHSRYLVNGKLPSHGNPQLSFEYSLERMWTDTFVVEMKTQHYKKLA